MYKLMKAMSIHFSLRVLSTGGALSRMIAGWCCWAVMYGYLVEGFDCSMAQWLYCSIALLFDCPIALLFDCLVGK